MFNFPAFNFYYHFLPLDFLCLRYDIVFASLKDEQLSQKSNTNVAMAQYVLFEIF